MVHDRPTSPPSDGYSFFSVLNECGSEVRMRSNSQAEIASMLLSARSVKSPSSPARRTSLPALRSPS